MATILRFLQVFALGTWTGGILFLSFAVAPGAFALLPTRELAGTLVGMALTRLHFFGCVAGVIYIGASLVQTRSVSALARPAVVLVILMLLLTVVSQHVVTPRIAGLRAQMSSTFGSVDATPQDNLLRAQFSRLHGISTSLELAVLLLGLVGLFLIVRSAF
ncbi:MAG TPA: DUF4149 domain-containing protein [Candidatus Acidoferrales bacterium]|nr:DUF4149 domain-containing protein [Candidatus Acidoferrales bacterium]